MAKKKEINRALAPLVISNQINRIISYLVEVGLSSDQNLAFVKNLRSNTVEVTFPHAEQLSIALKNESYSTIYASLSSERAYTVKLPDGALILIRYLYVENRLQQHSLGFYPSPDLEEFQNNPDIYWEEVAYADVIARNIVPFPIRFDYDCRDGVCKPVEHPKAHLTLGQYKNCRIPITAPLTPYWFVSFLLRNFYNTAFKKYSDSMPCFNDVFEDSIHLEERDLVHLQIPFGNQRIFS